MEEYKEIIIRLLDKADERKIKLIYCYVAALLGKIERRKKNGCKKVNQ